MARDQDRLARAAAGAPPVELGAGRCAVFADLHLRSDAGAEIEAFAASLRGIPADCSRVLVLGDLFDWWVGAEQWREPGFRPLAAALAELARRGIRVILLRGNRDVLLEDRDGAEVGAEVADAVLVEDCEGRMLLTHGDQFCLRDRPYQRLRRWLRRPWVRGLGRRLPYALRKRLAASLRGASRRAVARKPLDSMALVELAVAAELQHHGARRAVIGHLHVAEERVLPGGLELRILPAWSPGAPAVAVGRPAGQADVAANGCQA